VWNLFRETTANALRYLGKIGHFLGLGLLQRLKCRQRGFSAEF